MFLRRGLIIASMRGTRGGSYKHRWEMVLGGGTVLNCSRRDIVWTWGNSNLLVGFVRSGTGWGMELSLQGQ